MAPGRISEVDTTFIDKSNVFLELNSPSWRYPMHISIDNLYKDFETLVQKDNNYKNIDNDTLIIDPSTLKVKVNSSYIKTPNVFFEPFNNHNILYNQLPQNLSDVSTMHLVTDGNYLYIWVGNRWKRALLSEW